MSGYSTVGFDAMAVVSGLSANAKVILQNIGVKIITAGQLQESATNPNYLYFLDDVNSLAIYIDDPVLGNVWMGPTGYPIAGSTSLRNSVPNRDGAFFYNTDTEVVEQLIGGTWQTPVGGYSSVNAPNYIPFVGTVNLKVGSKYIATSMTANAILPNPTGLSIGHSVQVLALSTLPITTIDGPTVSAAFDTLEVVNPVSGNLELTTSVVLQKGVTYEFVLQDTNKWVMYTSQLPTAVTIYDMAGFDPSDYVLRNAASLLGLDFLAQADAASMRTLLELGTAATKNVGTGAAELVDNTRLQDSLASLNALAARGVTGPGRFVAEGFGNLGVVATGENWTTALTGGSRFLAGVTNSALEGVPMAGISAAGTDGVNTYQLQFLGRGSRVFGRTAEGAIPAPYFEFRTVQGTITDVDTDVFGLDANDYRTVGEWPVSSDVANLPDAVEGVLKVSGPQTPEAGYQLVQEFLPFSNTTPQHFYRTCKAGVYSPWASALTTAGLGTAASRDVGEAVGNVQLVGSFGGPTGTQVYFHSGNRFDLGATLATARAALGLKSAAFAAIGSASGEVPDTSILNQRLGTTGNLGTAALLDAAVATIANTVVRRTAEGRVKTTNATESNDAVAFGQLGTAALKPAMTSLTDASTPDALMLRGAFGFGSTYQGGVPTPTTPSSNLDGIGPMGHYRYAEDMIGRPNFGSGYGTVFNLPAIHVEGLNYGSQLAVDYSSNEMGFRQLTGNVWSGWCRTYHNRNAVGTVAQSGGIPTGAIIESGSNVYGNYVQYADGTQICYKLVDFSGVSINPANGTNLVTAQAVDVTPAADFVGTPVTSVGRFGLYDSSLSPIYTTIVAGSNAFTLLNTGRRPTDDWPSWVTVGTYVATQGFYEVIHIGRWY